MSAFIVFVVFALVCALASVWVRTPRYAILALWGMGLWTGVAYLAAGAEVLALLEWILSSVSTLSLVFFSLLFGEFTASERERTDRAGVPWFLALPTVLGFGAWMFLASPQADLPDALAAQSTSQLAEMGKRLIEEHWLASEVVGALLFISVVGAGIIARPDFVSGEESRGRG